MFGEQSLLIVQPRFEFAEFLRTLGALAFKTCDEGFALLVVRSLLLRELRQIGNALFELLLFLFLVRDGLDGIAGQPHQARDGTGQLLAGGDQGNFVGFRGHRGEFSPL